MKSPFLFFVLINLLSCNKNICEKSMAVFFNPISIKDNSYHFQILNNRTILIDTVIKSAKIDNSILVKCISLQDLDNITVDINNKRHIVDLESYKRKKGPVSIFTYYDDHLILDSLFQLYTKISIKKTGKIPVYKDFVNSITHHSSTERKYDSVIVNVKNDKCWCEGTTRPTN